MPKRKNFFIHALALSVPLLACSGIKEKQHRRYDSNLAQDENQARKSNPNPQIEADSEDGQLSRFNILCLDAKDPELIKTLAVLQQVLLASTCEEVFSALVFSTRLDLGGKDIKDLRPISFARNLDFLDLQRNSIDDLKPLADLKFLRFLDVSENFIGDISPLGQLTKLKELGIFGNQIENIEPLSGLKNLVFLKASTNKITDISPLSNLTNIENLTLHQNQLRDLSPLTQLTKLKSLNIQGNPNLLSGDPLRTLTNLNYLDIQGTGIVDLNFLAPLTQMSELRILGPNFNNLDPIGNLTNLKTMEFDFSSRGRNGQPYDYSFMRKLTKLESIFFWDLSLQDISFLQGMSLLKSLYLRPSAAANPNIIGTLPQITELEISGVNTNGTFLASLPKLEFLEIGPGLSSLTTVGKLTSLKELRIRSYTASTSFTPLSNLKNLQILRMDGTAGTDLTFLRAMPELIELQWTNSQITNLPLLSGLNKLSYVNFSGNRFALNLAEVFAPNSVEHLSLSGVPQRNLAGLEVYANLKELTLSFTGLTDCSPISNLPNLTLLELDGNELNSVACVGRLKKLQYLNIAGNTNLKTLDGIQGATMLLDIMSDECALTQLDPLKELHKLKFLSLKKNAIMSLDPVSKLERLESIQIDEPAVIPNDTICMRDGLNNAIRNLCRDLGLLPL